MNELKHCPFCGCDQVYSKAHSSSFNGEILRSVICGNCSATTRGYDEKPVNDWNARTQSRCNTYDIAKVCFDDIIDEDMLCEMKYQKMIACVDGFKAACIAQIQLAIESAPPKEQGQ